jgi:hypothetical protein
MEIRITTKQILIVLYIIAWLAFVGLSIDAGGFIVNTVIDMWFKPAAAAHFWRQADMSALYAYDRGHFLSVATLVCIAAVLKAILFYLIIKMIHDKKLDLSKPFNEGLRRFIVIAAYLAIGISFFAAWGAREIARFVKLGVKMPSLETLLLGGADVWLFMGVILFIIAQIFKRGIEIQSENDLTV